MMKEMDYFLCTFDYRKSKELIEAAYNIPERDELTKNLLYRMNRYSIAFIR